MHYYPRMLTTREIYSHKFVHEKVFFFVGYITNAFKTGPEANIYIWLRFLGNKITCFPRDQSLSVYYFNPFTPEPTVKPPVRIRVKVKVNFDILCVQGEEIFQPKPK